MDGLRFSIPAGLFGKGDKAKFFNILIQAKWKGDKEQAWKDYLKEKPEKAEPTKTETPE